MSMRNDLEDLWYSMIEPDGKRYDWDHAFQAFELCKKNDWSCIWGS
jgi:hypothetical protein